MVLGLKRYELFDYNRGFHPGHRRHTFPELVRQSLIASESLFVTKLLKGLCYIFSKAPAPAKGMEEGVDRFVSL